MNLLDLPASQVQEIFVREVAKLRWDGRAYWNAAETKQCLELPNFVADLNAVWPCLKNIWLAINEVEESISLDGHLHIQTTYDLNQPAKSIACALIEYHRLSLLPTRSHSPQPSHTNGIGGEGVRG